MVDSKECSEIVVDSSTAHVYKTSAEDDASVRKKIDMVVSNICPVVASNC